MKLFKIGLIDSSVKEIAHYENMLTNSSLAECLLTAKSIDDFLENYDPSVALDIILLEISILGSKQISVLNNLFPNIEIIVLTHTMEENLLLNTFKLGARGYLIKGFSLEELEDHLINIQNGGVAWSPIVATQVIKYFSSDKEKPNEI